MAVAVLATTLASRAKVQSTRRKNAPRTRGSTASRSAEPAADATTKRCKRTAACVSHAISRAIESPVRTVQALSLRDLSLPLSHSLSLSRSLALFLSHACGTSSLHSQRREHTVRRIPAKRLACRRADLANVTRTRGPIKRAPLYARSSMLAAELLMARGGAPRTRKRRNVLPDELRHRAPLVHSRAGARAHF